MHQNGGTKLALLLIRRMSAGECAATHNVMTSSIQREFAPSR